MKNFKHYGNKTETLECSFTDFSSLSDSVKYYFHILATLFVGLLSLLHKIKGRFVIDSSYFGWKITIRAEITIKEFGFIK